MTTINLEDINANPVSTNDSQLRIDMPNEKLPIGAHHFQLEVEDNSQNRSQPASVMVIVADTQAPTAVLQVMDAQGRALTNNSIGFGDSFILSGKHSFDLGGGQIVKYTWTKVD